VASPDEIPEFLQNARAFRTTHWSVVMQAGAPESGESKQALEELCRTYWFPIYGYIRSRGYSPDDAQDLVQAFFERFLEKNYLESVNAQRGKFRSFLLASVNHFLSNEWDRARAQKRGGGKVIESLDAEDAEGRYLHELADSETPESMFERNWAETVLASVLERLRDECNAGGRAGRFEALKGFLVGDKGELSFAEAADRLGVTEAAVKSFVRRLRLRYRELFREELAKTVDDPAQIEEELRHLVAILQR
jgi:RNA polymerase sigma-70 factor (ECF subfamily)